MNINFDKIIEDLDSIRSKDDNTVREEVNDLSELIIQMINTRSQKVEDELRKNNGTYVYSLMKIQTIMDYFMAKNDTDRKLIMQFEELENNIVAVLQNAMYVQGLRDGINMLNMAAGYKVMIFDKELV